MRNMVLTDENLRKAAQSVRNTMLTSLPHPTDCEIEFSNEFQTKMEHLRLKANIIAKRQKMVRSIASVLLVLLITSTLWLTVDAEAREIVFAWFRETYENSIVYHFLGQNEIGELPHYDPTWLPEGFEQEFEHRDEITHLRYYQKQNSLSGIAIEYYKANDGTHTEFIGKDVESLREEVYVNGKKADFYRADGNSNTNNLIWMEKKSGIVFIVSSDLDKSVIIRVAESLKQISVKK